jgi:hypothetical protein
MTRQDLTSLAGTIGLMVVTALAFIFVFVWPELRDWLIARTVVPVPIVAACIVPVDSTEQMHIVVVLRNGKLTAECMFIGSTGTYARSSRPGTRP